MAKEKPKKSVKPYRTPNQKPFEDGYEEDNEQKGFDNSEYPTLSKKTNTLSRMIGDGELEIRDFLKQGLDELTRRFEETLGDIEDSFFKGMSTVYTQVIERLTAVGFDKDEPLHKYLDKYDKLCRKSGLAERIAEIEPKAKKRAEIEKKQREKLRQKSYTPITFSDNMFGESPRETRLG
jgi:hypothetical protein